jgi:hypothetical protein
MDDNGPQKFIGAGVTTLAVDPSKSNSGVRR